MLKDITFLGIGAIFGLGATLTAMAAPLHYPNAPSWVWYWMFWSGIALMVVMLSDAALIAVRPVHWGPAFLGNVALLLLAAAVIWETMPDQTGSATKPLPVLAVECALSQLPTVMPQDGLAFIDFFYDPSWADDSGPIDFSRSTLQPGEKLQWYTDRKLGQTMRCVITNQEKYTLLAVRFSLKVRFLENVMRADGRATSSGDVIKERDWPLAISKIDAGKPFIFYALTQGKYFVDASFPQTANYFDPNTDTQKEARLLLLNWGSISVTPAELNNQKGPSPKH
jgi:hypothetical protein